MILRVWSNCRASVCEQLDMNHNVSEVDQSGAGVNGKDAPLTLEPQALRGTQAVFTLRTCKIYDSEIMGEFAKQTCNSMR